MIKGIRVNETVKKFADLSHFAVFREIYADGQLSPHYFLKLKPLREGAKSDPINTETVVNTVVLYSEDNYNPKDQYFNYFHCGDNQEVIEYDVILDVVRKN